VALLFIGVHQSRIHGFTNSYWIFMLMISTLILYQLRKNKRVEKEGSVTPPENKNNKKTILDKKKKLPFK